MVQEVVRILRNTSRNIDRDIKTNQLSEFSERLRISGYKQHARMEIIKRGVEAYEKQVERDKSGLCPLHRPKGYQKEVRLRKKRRNKAPWYKPHSTVMFCPPTPNGDLANKLREIVQIQKKEGGIDIKIVEKAGIKIGALLPGLRKKKGCGRDECFIHTTGGKGDCNKESVVYKGSCLKCKETGKECIYIGETSRSGYVRGKQHLEAIKNHQKHRSNAFAKHIEERHEGRETKFSMSIVKYLRTPLERQIREGVEIAREKNDIMNSKLDHFQPGIRKITFGNIFDNFGS